MLQIGILAFLFAFARSQCNETGAELQALCIIANNTSGHSTTEIQDGYFEFIREKFGNCSEGKDFCFTIQEGKVTRLFGQCSYSSHSHTVKEK